MTSPNPQEGGKHTPGPWRISDEIYIRDASRNGAYIAEIDPMTDFEGNEAEADANARLIAAAPALLEALQALYDDYKQLADSGDAGFWRLEDCDVGKQAMAALLQATGGENGR